MPHLRRRKTSASDTFSSMSNTLGGGPSELASSELDGLGDGLVSDPAAPRPANLLPRHPGGHLIQHLPHHYAASPKDRGAATDSRVGNDVRPQFHQVRTGRLEHNSFHGWNLHSSSSLVKPIPDFRGQHHHPFLLTSDEVVRAFPRRTCPSRVGRAPRSSPARSSHPPAPNRRCG